MNDSLAIADPDRGVKTGTKQKSCGQFRYFQERF